MRPFAAILAAALLLVGCQRSAADDGLQAVATVYPLAWLVQEIAPDAKVTSLAAQAQDPHDQELTPRQRAALGEADLVAYLGDIGFQPHVEGAVAESRGDVVSVKDVLGDRLRSLDGEAADPHVWFDPMLLAETATAIGDAAADADPENATAYTAAAERVAGELESLAGDIGDLLAACDHDQVGVSHEAYAYLLAPHGLEQHGISSAAGHSEATPSRIAELVDLVNDERLPAVLTEPVEGRTDAEVVAREAGVELIDIYSLDVVDDAQAEKGLPQLLREQAAAVARAAGCTS